MAGLGVGLVPAAQAADEGVPSLGGFVRAADGAAPAGWRVVGFPSTQKPVTRFVLTQRDGKTALQVEADRSYGNLVRELGPWATDRATLAWSWRAERLPTGADLRQRSGDDAGAKVCVFFDVPTSKMPVIERARLQVARLLTGEPVPPQALCYVWDASAPALPVGTHLPNAFTGLMRWVVLQSGEARRGQWVDERRNVAEDYRRVFGEDMPPITGVAIGADTDNTQSQSLFYFADVTLGR